MIERKKIDLVILAGGRGSRISKYLKNIPKPLYKFNKITFLQFLLNYYCKYPISTIYIIGGYKGSKIYNKFNNKVFNFVKIICLIEKEPMGTGGALSLVKKKIKNDFLVINGDSILMHDINFFFKKKFKSKKHIIFLTKKKNYISNKKLANIDINKKKQVIFKNKSNYMNAGVYFFKNKILKKIKNIPFSLETNLLVNLINSKEFNGVRSSKFFIDIGTPNNLKKAEKILIEKTKKKAAFFDRDGVINHDFGYVHKFENFKFFNGVLRSIRYLIENNYYIFIVTNQAGIAKKKFSYHDFFMLHEKLKFYLSKKNIYFDDVQFSPYHPESKIKKYRKKSILRKPNNGMIRNIIKKFNVDIKKSFMIGDQASDMLAAKKSNLYYENKKKEFFSQIKKISKKYEK